MQPKETRTVPTEEIAKLKKGFEQALEALVPVYSSQPTTGDMVRSIVMDEFARFVARVLKRAFNEIPEDKLKDGVISLWDMLSELPDIIGPDLMQEITELVKKIKERAEEHKKKAEEETKKAHDKFLKAVKAVNDVSYPPPSEKEKPEG